MTSTTGMKSKTGGIDPTLNFPNPNPPTPRNFCHDKPSVSKLKVFEQNNLFLLLKK